VEGVPYAEPPVGPLRWMPPIPAKSWQGVRDCTGPGHVCPQVEQEDHFGNYTGNMIGSEDCLYLNVYSTQPEEALLPVLVWIHGGGFTAGAGAWYRPEYLLDYNLVVVSINYRLGALGFLSLESPSVSGNQGLRDQALALEWVQINIAAFGGDPTRVTIMGESAGSWSVFYQLLNPSSTGFFSAAIGQSGAVTGGVGWGQSFTREEAASNGRNLAAAFNCTSSDVEQVEACLREVDAIDLSRPETAFFYEVKANIDSFSSFQPVLPYAPQEMLDFQLFNQVPVLIGGTSGEAATLMKNYYLYPELMTELNEEVKWDELMAAWRVFQGPVSSTCPAEYSQAAKQFYFGQTIEQDEVGSLVEMLTDVWLWRGIEVMADTLSQFVPVYQYIFSFEDPTRPAWYKPMRGSGLGIPHFDDMPYFFAMPPAGDIEEWSEATLTTQKRLCSMWSTFATHHQPTTANNSEPSFSGITWKARTPLEKSYLNISAEPQMESSQDYWRRMDFWSQTVQAGC